MIYDALEQDGRFTSFDAWVIVDIYGLMRGVGCTPYSTSRNCSENVT